MVGNSPQYVRKVDGRAVEYLRLSNNDTGRHVQAERKRPTIEQLKDP